MHGDDPAGTPLIPPLPRAAWDERVRAFFGIMEGPQAAAEGTRFTVQAVMANHVELVTAWATFNRKLVREGELAADLRELAILRTAWNLKAGYEWHQHRMIARRGVLSEDQLAAVEAGPAAAVWNELERLVLTCADGMTRDACATPATVTALREALGERQLMELLWVIGSYGALGLIFNSLAVPIEAFVLSQSEQPKSVRLE